MFQKHLHKDLCCMHKYIHAQIHVHIYIYMCTTCYNIYSGAVSQHVWVSNIVVFKQLFGETRI